MWGVIAVLISVSCLTFFLLDDVLSYRINSNNYSQFEIQLAEKRQLPSFYKLQYRNSSKGSQHWLLAITRLAKYDPHYALELADFYLEDDDLDKSDFWYLRAVEKGNEKARYRLATSYFKQHKYVDAKRILITNKPLPISMLELLIKIALIEGDITQVNQLTSTLYQQNGESELLAELARYSIPMSAKQPLYEQPKSSCLVSIQMFATNLNDLRKVTQLINQKNQFLLHNFICFSSPRYISISRLKCRHDNDETIRCDESIWRSYENSVTTRYIGVMVPSGGANVHNGIMYIDSHDSIDVFVHELSHLLGFIDEYPLPKNHAKCFQVQSTPFSHNVVVLTRISNAKVKPKRENILAKLPWRNQIKFTTPLVTYTDSGWVLGTPKAYKTEIGLFPTNTCSGTRIGNKNNSIQAFKPISELTKLEHYELEFPPQYKRIFEDKPKAYLMPSFHTNILDATHR